MDARLDEMEAQVKTLKNVILCISAAALMMGSSKDEANTDGDNANNDVNTDANTDEPGHDNLGTSSDRQSKVYSCYVVIHQEYQSFKAVIDFNYLFYTFEHLTYIYVNSYNWR